MLFLMHLLVQKEKLQTRQLSQAGREFLLIIAEGFWPRFFGWRLAGLFEHPNPLIFIPRCRAVQQWLDCSSLAVFFIDAHGRVLAQNTMGFGQFRYCWQAYGVIEGPVQQMELIRLLLSNKKICYR